MLIALWPVKRIFPVDILGELLSPIDTARNVVVWFDPHLSLSKYVWSISKQCFIHMRDLRQMWQYLTRGAAFTVANALVGNRLDYSLFRSLSAADLSKVQCVQNSLARIAWRATKYSQITLISRVLHWLPIHAIFKTGLLVYKLLHLDCPKYSSLYLTSRQSAYNTCRSLPVCSICL